MECNCFYHLLTLWTHKRCFDAAEYSQKIYAGTLCNDAPFFAIHLKSMCYGLLFLGGGNKNSFEALNK